MACFTDYSITCTVQQNNTVLVREAVYFVVVLRQLETVVVAVRGTETPEDLLTDGLGRECKLSDSDLLGLLKSVLLELNSDIICGVNSRVPYIPLVTNIH
jgi:hypothetical protein